MNNKENEHDELIRLREQYKFTEGMRKYYKGLFDIIFDFWNERCPDEMDECMNKLWPEVVDE